MLKMSAAIKFPNYLKIAYVKIYHCTHFQNEVLKLLAITPKMDKELIRFRVSNLGREKFSIPQSQKGLLDYFEAKVVMRNSKSLPHLKQAIRINGSKKLHRNIVKKTS